MSYKQRVWLCHFEPLFISSLHSSLFVSFYVSFCMFLFFPAPMEAQLHNSDDHCYQLPASKHLANKQRHQMWEENRWVERSWWGQKLCKNPDFNALVKQWRKVFSGPRHRLPTCWGGGGGTVCCSSKRSLAVSLPVTITEHSAKHHGFSFVLYLLELQPPHFRSLRHKLTACPESIFACLSLRAAWKHIKHYTTCMLCSRISQRSRLSAIFLSLVACMFLLWKPSFLDCISGPRSAWQECWSQTAPHKFKKSIYKECGQSWNCHHWHQGSDNLTMRIHRHPHLSVLGHKHRLCTVCYRVLSKNVECQTNSGPNFFRIPLHPHTGHFSGCPHVQWSLNNPWAISQSILHSIPCWIASG